MGRCLFWVSYFLFCCQNSFHLLSSFDWLPVEFQIQSNRWLERGFHNVPWALVKSHLPPRHCSFWQTFKASPACFPLQNYPVLGSHQSIFCYYPSEVLAIAALCRRSEYIIHIGTDVFKINFLLMIANVLKCHRGNMFV